MNKFSLVLVVALSGSALASAKDYVLSSFKKIQLSDKFWCEGASFGDFNHDGKPDQATANIPTDIGTYSISVLINDTR